VSGLEPKTGRVPDPNGAGDHRARQSLHVFLGGLVAFMGNVSVQT